MASNARNVNYVFGFGSLICPESRASTVPLLSQRTAIPVRVHGLVRTWNCRCYNPPSTFLGVQQLPALKRDKSKKRPSFCNGVLIQVYDDEIPALDERELGYKRHLIDPSNIERVDELLAEEKVAQQQAADDCYKDTFLRANNVDTKPAN